jgi:YceI-like domain
MHTFGPENATLTVQTKRSGAAQKAGHDLLIEVTSWSATLDEGSITLSADPSSLRVLEGTGGMMALGDDDKAGIAQTIDEEVLKGTPIEFRSTSVEPGPGKAAGELEVAGELELAGERRSIEFELTSADGRITGAATLKQSDWGMKPYSALFGTLKVADEVVVEIDARLA